MKGYKELPPHLFTARKELGQSLRLARESKGLTTANLAEMVGIDRTTVSKMEAANWSPTVDHINRVAAALGYKLTLVPNERI